MTASSFTVPKQAMATPPSSDSGKAIRLWLERGNNAVFLLFLLWIVYTVTRIFLSWNSIETLDFSDPDDFMRMVQVRDFLAGQNWFDVSQHRINPPAGGPMHWSRLVDLPIAGLILLLRPLLGETLAESMAAALVPCITFGLIAGGLFLSMRRLMGTMASLLAALSLATSVFVLVQVAPLRIDHHAWQTFMAVGMLGGLLHADPRRGGWIMGLSIALWLHISSEGLPYAALAGGILTLRYAIRPAEWPRLIRYVGVMSAASLFLLLLTHGWRASLVSHCDSMSPVYLAPLCLLFPCLLAGHKIIGEKSAVHRLLPIGIAGAGAAALFLSTAGRCLAGPFSMLDPLVYTVWYLNIAEGQPLWTQKTSLIGTALTPVLVGLAGLLAATVTEKQPDRRLDWASVFCFALGSFAISVMVLRAMSAAHLFAAIGSAWIITRLYPIIAARSLAATRIIMSLTLVLLTPAGLVLLGQEITSILHPTPPETASKASKTGSFRASISALNTLPPAIIMAPMDIGPTILARTGHSVIATGHHRNAATMTIVVQAFTLPPEQARAVITASSARYLLIAPGLNEATEYKRYAPNGLAAALLNGKPPIWLKPVALPGLGQTRLWEIERTSPPARR